jgi:hypothetical protein
VGGNDVAAPALMLISFPNPIPVYQTMFFFFF